MLGASLPTFEGTESMTKFPHTRPPPGRGGAAQSTAGGDVFGEQLPLFSAGSQRPPSSAANRNPLRPCTPPGSMEWFGANVARSERWRSGWDHEFESPLLRRGVRCEPEVKVRDRDFANNHRTLIAIRLKRLCNLDWSNAHKFQQRRLHDCTALAGDSNPRDSWHWLVLLLRSYTALSSCRFTLD